MFLMIDNYDSFVYNLVSYFNELGKDVDVVKNDEISLDYIDNINELEGIIISPGPKTPHECGICLDVIRKYMGQVPILGVCLGHQIIAHYFDAEVRKGIRPMHGKVSKIHTTGHNLFNMIPTTYNVTRYHSLVVDKNTLSSDFTVDAVSEDGEIMAISHKNYPIYGVQFHPEAVLTEYGHELLNNFIDICTKFNSNEQVI